jgi:hypothetical protein
VVEAVVLIRAGLRRGHADRGEQNCSSESHLNRVKRASIPLDNGKAFFGLGAADFIAIRVHGAIIRFAKEAPMDTTALILSRLQFAFTITFHIIFPAFTIGLAAWLTVLDALHLTTGRPADRVLFEFWLKIFGVAPPGGSNPRWETSVSRGKLRVTVFHGSPPLLAKYVTGRAASTSATSPTPSRTA